MSQYINQFDQKSQEDVSDIRKIVVYLKSIRSLLIYAVILLFLKMRQLLGEVPAKRNSSMLHI